MSYLIEQEIETPQGATFESFDPATMTMKFRLSKEAAANRYIPREVLLGEDYYTVVMTEDGQLSVDTGGYDGDNLDEAARNSYNFDAEESEMILALNKFKLDRKLRIAEARENPVGWRNREGNAVYTLRLTIGSGWDVVGDDETWHWFTFGQFATRTGAERFLFSLTDDEKETLLTYWRIK